MFSFILTFQSITVTLTTKDELYLTVDFIGDTCLDEIELDHYFRFSPFYDCFGHHSPQWLDQIVPGEPIINNQDPSDDDNYSPPSGYDFDKSPKGPYQDKIISCFL